MVELVVVSRVEDHDDGGVEDRGNEVSKIMTMARSKIAATARSKIMMMEGRIS
jgi:hypothetical protein